MFYHVLIEVNQKIEHSRDNSIKTETDIINKDEVLKDILVPYLSNEEFLFNGYMLTKADIIRLLVVTTNTLLKIIVDKANTNLPEGLLMYLSPTDILLDDSYTTDVTKELLFEAKKMISKPLATQNPTNEVLKTKVFIVHGRDNEIKNEVARFIEKIGLIPIILNEQASKGMTIIEKIEEYSDVGFAVILYTPCDVGYIKENESQKMYRARQNVVFEHGYMIAKLGRQNVCALVKQEVEKPNDISGIIYINYDSNDGWKIPLAKELKSSGYKIDFNQVV